MEAPPSAICNALGRPADVTAENDTEGERSGIESRGKSILKMVENRYRHRRKNDIKYMGKLISLPRKNGLRVKQCP